MTPARIAALRRWAGLTPKAFLQALTLDGARQLLRDSASVLDKGSYGLVIPGVGKKGKAKSLPLVPVSYSAATDTASTKASALWNTSLASVGRPSPTSIVIRLPAAVTIPTSAIAR